MSVNQLRLDTLDAPFVTRNLFTRHFLLSRLPKHPVWKSLLPDAKKARDDILTLYNAKKKTLSKMTEAQLEHEFVRKVLDILGHKGSYTVQTPMLLGFGKFKVPDHVFFKDEETKNRAYEIRTEESERFYSMASGIGEAKEWGLDLNKKPSTQIMTYLKFGGPRWGILTNGKKWRVYHKEARVDSYYEVDLIDHLENGNNEKFNYFFLFFRREAFVAEGVKDRCFLDEVLDGSLRFAKQLEDDVRENVYRALRLLCKGFLKYPKNDLNPEDLPRIRESCLILLYRLLFVLYAEAKRLLPLEEPMGANEYGSISLEALRREVANNKKDRKILPTLDTHWTHLKRLFEFINEGSEKQGVPKEELFITSYNGGLFDPERDENKFLEEKRIGNQYLDDALDLLSRSKDDEGNLVEVDYDTLSIRHLGSIYEGLLEYKVVPASEDLAEVEGVDTYVSIAKAQQEKKKILATYEEGEPILQTDKGERKATGSYYTPDYIVKYIVKNTVGPLIDEKHKEWENGDKQEPLWKKYLELKALDPAMGSGHFLVEVVNFIGEELLQAWMQEHAEDETPPPEEGTIEWARHEVVRHCVFGVDSNPLAVELAKLSLWLATVQVNRPLSFLDHHLKCGNSLIGARLNELAWYPGGKLKETTIPPALIENLESAVKKINATSDETVEGVKQQEALFNRLKKTSEYIRIKTLADARVSLYFGTTIDTPKPKDVYDTFVKTTFEGDENLWKKRIGQNWIKNAKDMAEIKHFFHWELEFPEIFFESGKPKENPGFDAVMGNPPYVRMRELPQRENEFFKYQFTVGKAQFDLYSLFLEAGLKLSKQGGSEGMIVSNKFFATKYGLILRKLMLTKYTVDVIADLGSGVFEDTPIETTILLCRNKQPAKHTMIRILIARKSKETIAKLKPSNVEQSFFKSVPEMIFAVDVNEDDALLLEKVWKNATTFGMHSKYNYGVGITSIEGHVRKDDDTGSSTQKLLPCYSGASVWRYFLDRNLYVVDYEGTPLLQSLFSRDFVYKNKVLIRELGTVPRATVHTQPSYLLNTVAFLTSDELSPYYLLAIFNSKFTHYYFLKLFESTRTHMNLRFKKMYVEKCPLPSISFTIPQYKRGKITSQAISLYSKYLVTKDITMLLKFVSDRLSAQPEESDVIHDFLAYLAEQMIELNKVKYKTLNRFKIDLEGLLGDRIKQLNRLYSPPKPPGFAKNTDELILHERVKRYEEKKAEAEKLLGGALSKKKLELEDFPILTEDQLKELLKKKLGRIPNLSQVLMIFQKYRDEIEIDSDKIAGGKVIGLKTLYARIDSPYVGSTDWLIDQIVYKLYGLTDEEIAIVEENFDR